MKKFVSLLVIALTLGACSNDDDGGNETSSLVGTWILTSYILDQPVDVNLDGTASNDFLEELPCYMSTATFSENGAFASSTSEIDIEIDIINGTADVVCIDPVALTGTWELNGDQLSITAEGETDTETVDLNGNTLTFAVEDPDFGTATWIWTRN
ncbi:MAG: lipocalin family protein [Flavobacteriaceae bacterium]|nr:lipocalin family protein [Flavobacteriaceae bacterium]